MKIILLSGGSGQRLWPLSNDARSKQFLRMLTSDDGSKESMIQRVVRQIKEADLTNDIIVATGAAQRDAAELQLGGDAHVLIEPSRRDTFPAIALTCAYLASQNTDKNEVIVVMPCDTYTQLSYFQAVNKMAEAIEEDDYKLIMMGIRPTYPSAKYGYLLPATAGSGSTMDVAQFIEKPDTATARKIIEQGGLWNGGVFAFRLEYMLDVLAKNGYPANFDDLYANYQQLPNISFDYEVAEKEKSSALVPYYGEWKDLGTWNTLTDELQNHVFGNVAAKNSESSYIINELEMPLVCIGAKDMVIAASPDGILVTERGDSEQLKHIVHTIGRRPMYEERRWGEYKVIDSVKFDDGFCALTKQLTLRPGKNISYQRHSHRDEVWTFVNGEGEIVLDGVRQKVKRGDVFNIPRGQKHALRAITSLTFIEVQEGSPLIEEDIERFEYDWD